MCFFVHRLFSGYNRYYPTKYHKSTKIENLCIINMNSICVEYKTQRYLPYTLYIHTYYIIYIHIILYLLIYVWINDKIPIVILLYQQINDSNKWVASVYWENELQIDVAVRDTRRSWNCRDKVWSKLTDICILASIDVRRILKDLVHCSLCSGPEARQRQLRYDANDILRLWQQWNGMRQPNR